MTSNCFFFYTILLLSKRIIVTVGHCSVRFRQCYPILTDICFLFVLKYRLLYCTFVKENLKTTHPSTCWWRERRHSLIKGALLYFYNWLRPTGSYHNNRWRCVCTNKLSVGLIGPLDNLLFLDKTGLLRSIFTIYMSIYEIILDTISML